MAKKGEKAKTARGPKIFRNEPKPPVITPTHYIHEYARVHDKSDTWLTNALADVARGGKLNENTGKIETKEQIDKRQAAAQQPKKKQPHELGDIMRMVNGFIFLTCTCGLKLKVPPNYKSSKVACPRCKTKLSLKTA